MQSNIEITPSFVLIVGCFVLVFAVASKDDSRPTLKADTRVEKEEDDDDPVFVGEQHVFIRRPIDFKKQLDNHQRNLDLRYSRILGGDDDLDIIRLRGVVSIDSEPPGGLNLLALPFSLTIDRKPVEGDVIFHTKPDDPIVLVIWTNTPSPITFLKNQYSLSDSSTPMIRLASNNTLHCRTGTQDIFVRFHDAVPSDMFTLINTYARPPRTGWLYGGKKRKSLKQKGPNKRLT